MSIPPASDLIEEHDWVIDPVIVRSHFDHHLTVAIYGNVDLSPIGNLAIECLDCGEVIGDIDFAQQASPQRA